MEKVRFKIAKGPRDGQYAHSEEVEGIIAFEKFGYQFVAHNQTESTVHGDFQVWEISELSTGFRLPFNIPCHDLSEAIERAKKFLDEKGERLTHEVVVKAKAILGK